MKMSLTRDQKRRIRTHIANLSSPDQTAACRAQTCLIRYYGALALEELEWAGISDDPEVRFRAAWALGHTHDERALEPLLRLTDDPDERVRYDATVALGILGDRRAIAPLIRMWLMDDVSRPAGMALAKLGPVALPEVEEVLANASPAMRHSAVQVIGSFADEHGDERSVVLLRGLAKDLDATVRADARFWLDEVRASRTAIGRTPRKARNRGPGEQTVRTQKQ